MTSDDGIIMKKQQLIISQKHGWASRFKYLFLMLSALSLFSLSAQNALAADLQTVGYSSLPEEKVQIVLTFSETIDEPSSFSIDDPARVVLDFAGVRNQLDKKTQQVKMLEDFASIGPGL